MQIVPICTTKILPGIPPKICLPRNSCDDSEDAFSNSIVPPTIFLRYFSVESSQISLRHPKIDFLGYSTGFSENPSRNFIVDFLNNFFENSLRILPAISLAINISEISRILNKFSEFQKAFFLRNLLSFFNESSINLSKDPSLNSYQDDQDASIKMR